MDMERADLFGPCCGGEGQQHAARRADGGGVEKRPLDDVEAGERCGGLHAAKAVAGNNDRQGADGGKQPTGMKAQVLKGQRIGVAGKRALRVGALHCSREEGGIAHDGIEERIGVVLLQRQVEHTDLAGEGGCLHVLQSLPARLWLDVDGNDPGVGEALRHQQGNETRAGAHVENAAAAGGPGSEQRPIGAHLHGRALLADCELLETKSAPLHALRFR